MAFENKFIVGCACCSKCKTDICADTPALGYSCCTTCVDNPTYLLFETPFRYACGEVPGSAARASTRCDWKYFDAYGQFDSGVSPLPLHPTQEFPNGLILASRSCIYVLALFGLSGCGDTDSLLVDCEGTGPNDLPPTSNAFYTPNRSDYSNQKWYFWKLTWAGSASQLELMYGNSNTHAGVLAAVPALDVFGLVSPKYTLSDPPGFSCECRQTFKLDTAQEDYPEAFKLKSTVCVGPVFASGGCFPAGVVPNCFGESKYIELNVDITTKYCTISGPVKLFPNTDYGSCDWYSARRKATDPGKRNNVFYVVRWFRGYPTASDTFGQLLVYVENMNGVQFTLHYTLDLAGMSDCNEGTVFTANFQGVIEEACSPTGYKFNACVVGGNFNQFNNSPFREMCYRGLDRQVSSTDATLTFRGGCDTDGNTGLACPAVGDVVTPPCPAPVCSDFAGCYRVTGSRTFTYGTNTASLSFKFMAFARYGQPAHYSLSMGGVDPGCIVRTNGSCGDGYSMYYPGQSEVFGISSLSGYFNLLLGYLRLGFSSSDCNFMAVDYECGVPDLVDDTFGNSQRPVLIPPREPCVLTLTKVDCACKCFTGTAKGPPVRTYQYSRGWAAPYPGLAGCVAGDCGCPPYNLPCVPLGPGSGACYQFGVGYYSCGYFSLGGGQTVDLDFQATHPYLAAGGFAVGGCGLRASYTPQLSFAPTNPPADFQTNLSFSQMRIPMETLGYNLNTANLIVSFGDNVPHYYFDNGTTRGFIDGTWTPTNDNTPRATLDVLYTCTNFDYETGGTFTADAINMIDVNVVRFSWQPDPIVLSPKTC